MARIEVLEAPATIPGSGPAVLNAEGNFVNARGDKLHITQFRALKVLHKEAGELVAATKNASVNVRIAAGLSTRVGGGGTRARTEYHRLLEVQFAGGETGLVRVDGEAFDKLTAMQLRHEYGDVRVLDVQFAPVVRRAPRVPLWGRRWVLMLGTIPMFATLAAILPNDPEVAFILSASAALLIRHKATS